MNINKNSIHAIIPARAGSKAIKDKNIVNVLGKPLIAWSIELAKSSRLIDDTFVSTDSQKIQKIANQYGVTSPYLRPKSISEDTSMDYEFIMFHLDWLKENDLKLPYAIVHLRPTGPARCLKDLDFAVSIIKSNPELTGLKSISLSKNTPYKMWREENNIIHHLLSIDGLNDFEESHYLPRQSLPKTYWQNGYIDIIKTETIMTNRSMVGNNCYGLKTSQSVADLDYMSDLPEIEKALIDIKEQKIISLLSDESENHSV